MLRFFLKISYVFLVLQRCAKVHKGSKFKASGTVRAPSHISTVVWSKKHRRITTRRKAWPQKQPRPNPVLWLIVDSKHQDFCIAESEGKGKFILPNFFFRSTTTANRKEHCRDCAMFFFFLLFPMQTEIPHAYAYANCAVDDALELFSGQKVRMPEKITLNDVIVRAVTSSAQASLFSSSFIFLLFHATTSFQFLNNLVFKCDWFISQRLKIGQIGQEKHFSLAVQFYDDGVLASRVLRKADSLGVKDIAKQLQVGPRLLPCAFRISTWYGIQSVTSESMFFLSFYRKTAMWSRRRYPKFLTGEICGQLESSIYDYCYDTAKTHSWILASCMFLFRVVSLIGSKLDQVTEILASSQQWVISVGDAMVRIDAKTKTASKIVTLALSYNAAVISDTDAVKFLDDVKNSIERPVFILTGRPITSKSATDDDAI